MFPFHDTFTNLFNRMKSLFISSSTEPNQSKSQPSEHDPLLPPATLPKDLFTDASESTSTSDDDSDFNNSSHYGTMFNPNTLHSHDTDIDRITGLIVSSMSLFFSITLSLVLLVLCEVGKHRAREEIDLVTLGGMIISLGFGITGLWGLVFRGKAGFTRWMVGVLVFGLVVLVNSLLITYLLGQLRKV
jgi:hypothetical protein